MDHDSWSRHLDYFSKPPFGGKPNTKPGDHGNPLTTVVLFYVIMCEDPHKKKFIEIVFG
jgi:hypothetical protein